MCIYSPMPHTLSYCALIGKCALIRSNTVCHHYSAVGPLRVTFVSTGWNSKAASTWKYLVSKFPDNLDLQRQWGVSYLMVGQNEQARNVFQQVSVDSAQNYRCHIIF